MRPTFIQIRHHLTRDSITLHFVEDEIPEFGIEEYESDFDRKIVFRTRTYSLQVLHENYYTTSLELIDGATGKSLVYIHNIPLDLSMGLEDIGRNRIPSLGEVITFDPFALAHDSDSRYTGSDDDLNSTSGWVSESEPKQSFDDDRATFSDTSF